MQQHQQRPTQDSDFGSSGLVQIPALEVKNILRELNSLKSLVAGLVRQVDSIEDGFRVSQERVLKTIDPVKARLLDVETRIDNALNIASSFPTL